MTAPTELHDAIMFFRFLHDDRRGYLFINAGVADDTTPTGIRMLLPDDDHPDVPSTRRWFYYDPERPDILAAAARYVLQLEAAHGNVYTGRTLFRQKSAKAECAYASPIIFLDDAPRDTPLPYSRYHDTGTGNGQAFYKLTSNATKADTKRITRALGCDPTGSADNKVLRIPGTRNTKAKHGGNYPVGLELETSGSYTADQIRAVFPPAEGEAPERERAARPWDTDKEQRLTAVYQSVKRMLLPDGSPRVLQNADRCNQGWRIFNDPEHYGSFRHPSGTWDASTVRHIRVKALILRGLTDEQVAAVVRACEDPATIAAKGSIATWNDIKGRVDFWRAQYPNVTISDYSRTLQIDMCRNYDNTVPEAEPPRPTRGRPRITPALDRILDTYRAQAEGGALRLSRHERAALLGCSTATLDRNEAILRDRGDIIVHTSADRRASWIELPIGVINNPSRTVPAAPAEAAPGPIGVIKNQPTVPIVITPAPMPAERARTPETAQPSHAHAHVVTHVSRAHPREAEPPPTAGASAPCVSPPAPIEHIRLAGRSAPLIDLVDRALDLVADTPLRKQRPLVEVLVAAERPNTAPEAITRALTEARDLRRLRVMPDRALARERAKRMNAANKAWAAVGVENVAALLARQDDDGTPIAGSDQRTRQAWAMHYRVRTADRAWVERYGALPSDITPATETRASVGELCAPRMIREWEAERAARALMYKTGIGFNTPRPRRPVPPMEEPTELPIDPPATGTAASLLATLRALKASRQADRALATAV